jgi:hypothetical protein
MQDYYEQTLFKGVPNVAVNLSFVGTLASVFLNAASPLAQVYASLFGIRVSLITGTIVLTLGLEMAGFSTQVGYTLKQVPLFLLIVFFFFFFFFVIFDMGFFF